MHNWYDIQQQIEAYAGRMVELFELRREAVKAGLAVFNGELSDNWEMWKEAALKSTGCLAPDFDEAPNTTYAVNADPAPGVLLSTDGSQVFPSRHEIAPLAMVTVSRIRIDYHHYDDDPLLDSRAAVFLQEDFNELVGPEREISFDDLVSDRRALEELETLAALAEEQKNKADGVPIIALSDGSLILWRLADRFKYEKDDNHQIHEKTYESKIVEKYIENLKRFEACGVPIAGYISSSNSREVVNLIKMVQKDQQEDWTPVSNLEPVLTDTEIFSRILKKGRRSTLFHSQSRIVREKYDDQKISYFFLHVGDEIAKIEMPQWIAQNKERVDEVAAYCLHQAQIGGGYPIVLAEAHENAVVRGPDRNAFFGLVEEALQRQGFNPQTSAKQLRKRTPIM